MRLDARYLRIVAAPIVVMALAACGGGTPTASPAPVSPTGTAIAVTLQEWAIVPASSSVAAGAVTFSVKNTGPADIHEFVVLKTDLEPGSLPTDANGAVTEDSGGMTVVDEIEDIPLGATQELAVTLAAGKYVLLCNIYSETEKEAHYQMGMRIAFTVGG